MKLAQILFPLGFVFLSDVSAFAQDGNIVGEWQLVKQSTCMQESANNEDETLESLRDDMHSRTSASPKTVSFRANASGEESTRILNSGRTANTKKFYYKFNGEMLLILDKKSQTITDSYLVDKFTADSLIIYNSSRPCETRVFVKINPGNPN
jgi:hypothetical protein